MLRAIAAHTAPFIIQRVPEISKVRAGFILTYLFAETIIRYQKIIISKEQEILWLRYCKSCQIGLTRFFQSYLISVPASSTIAIIGAACPLVIKQIGPKLSFVRPLMELTLFSGNIAAKVVNSFAIGLLAQRTFSKDPNPGFVMAIITISILALSGWNVWNIKRLPIKKELN